MSYDAFKIKFGLISERLIDSLLKADYVCYTEYQPYPKEHVCRYHYFKIQVKGVSLYFNIQLTAQRKLVLYTIIDKLAV